MRTLVFFCAPGRRIKTRKLDQDQYQGFQDKRKPKMVVNGSEILYRNSVISQDSSPRNSMGESSIDELHIPEQDLGSDAESLPSCEDSYTASESPPASPELSFEHSKASTGRRVSAPDITKPDIFLEENVKTLRRRNSSVEVRTNKVRFHLEESFKNEENQFHNQYHDDAEKSWSVDVKSTTVCDNNRKISLTSINKPERKRKTSVFSDTSERSIGVINTINNYTSQKVASHENNIKHDASPKSRKTSLQERKQSLQENKQRHKKQSLQETIFKSDRKISLQEKNSDRKTSLQDHRKLSLQVQDRKLSHQERKISTDRKLSIPFDRRMSSSDRKMSSSDRKMSSSDRKTSSSERKYSSNERKISFTDTVRAVVGTKKKSERRVSLPDSSSSPDENNNTSDKKSTWGILKNKIKKDRKYSENSPRNSPKVVTRQLSRNDSGSSNESFRRGRTDSKNRLRTRAYSEQDRYSVSSFTSFELDEHHTEKQHTKQYEIPPCSFDVWSEGKVELKIENKTLPLLHVAAGEGNYTLLKTLLDVGVEVNEIDHAGWPALHYAVCGGHFKCAQLLIEKGAVLKSYSNKVTNSYCAAVRNCIMTPPSTA